MHEAEMVAEVETRTIDVLTVKVALVAPAGMNTLEGTLAAPLLLESVTLKPPAGAVPLSLTVPVEVCNPPTTLAGFSVSEESVITGGGAGVTVSEAVLVTPAWAAEKVTAVDEATALVLTINVAVVAPAATVTPEGTLAAAVLLLESATCTPPAGAGALSVTVPVEDCAPPTTLVGFRLSDERVAGGGGTAATVSEAVLVTPA